MRLSDYSVLSKILVCIGMLGIVTLGTLAYTSWAMIDIDAGYMDMVENEAVAVEDSLEAEIQIARFSGALLGLAAASDPQQLKALSNELIAESSKFIEKLNDAKSHEESLADRFTALEQSFNKSKERLAELQGAVATGQDSQTTKLAIEMRDKIEVIAAELEKISAQFRADMNARVKAEQAETDSTILYSFIIVIAALAAITGLATVIANSGISAPILRIVEVMTSSPTRSASTISPAPSARTRSARWPAR